MSGTAPVMRPIPAPDAASETFWQRLAGGELVLPACDSCNQLQYPPQVHCSACGGTLLTHQKLSGYGEVYSFTRLSHAPAPGFADRLPLNVSVIELAEQRGLFMVAQVDHPEDEPVSISQQVELSVEQLNDDIFLPSFKVVQT